MKPISDGFLDEHESVAREGLKRIKAYFAYQGSERIYYDKARVGATVTTAYARLRASETNRMAVELAAKKTGTEQK